LASLHQTASTLSSRIQLITYEHVYRTENKRADELANLALKNKETQLENVNILEDPKLIPITKQTPIKHAISKMFSKGKNV
jgi:hypothetical protein